MREQPDDRDPGPERETGGEQRQCCRQQRPEYEEQHDRGREEAQAEAAGVAVRVARPRDLAFDLELETVARAGGDLGYERLGRRLRDFVRPDVERHIRECDLPRWGDLSRSGGRVWRLDPGHVRLQGNPCEQPLHARPHGRIRDPALFCGDHDLIGVAGGLRRVALQQRDRVEALCVGEVEVVGVRAADARLDRVQAGDCSHPGEQHDDPVVEAPSCKRSHRGAEPPSANGCGRLLRGPDCPCGP